MSYGIRQALRTPFFWQLGIASSLGQLVSSTNLLHLAALRDFGVSPGIAALAAGAVAIGDLLGRGGTALVGDRFDKRFLLAWAYLIQTLGVLSLALVNAEVFGVYLGLLPLPVFSIAFGMGFGASVPLRLAIIGDYYGRRNYGSIVGIMSSVNAVFGALGPVFRRARVRRHCELQACVHNPVHFGGHSRPAVVDPGTPGPRRRQVPPVRSRSRPERVRVAERLAANRQTGSAPHARAVFPTSGRGKNGILAATPKRSRDPGASPGDCPFCALPAKLGRLAFGGLFNGRREASKVSTTAVRQAIVLRPHLRSLTLPRISLSGTRRGLPSKSFRYPRRGSVCPSP